MQSNIYAKIPSSGGLRNTMVGFSQQCHSCTLLLPKAQTLLAAFDELLAYFITSPFFSFSKPIGSHYLLIFSVMKKKEIIAEKLQIKKDCKEYGSCYANNFSFLKSNFEVKQCAQNKDMNMQCILSLAILVQSKTIFFFPY